MMDNLHYMLCCKDCWLETVESDAWIEFIGLDQ